MKSYELLYICKRIFQTNLNINIMKNIIVGIDFSENSENALRHAIAVALKSKAIIHVVWVKTPTASTKLDVSNEDDMMNKVHGRLNELVKWARAEAPSLEIRPVILEGTKSSGAFVASRRIRIDITSSAVMS